MSDSFHDEISSDGCSDDEIPVAQLARYKLARHTMEKKGKALANPKKDLSASSDDTDSDDIDSDDTDSDNSEDSDYHGEEEVMAQRRYLNRQRLERGRARAAFKHLSYLQYTPKQEQKSTGPPMKKLHSGKMPLHRK